MNRVAYCPDCGSAQPHRYAADEPGDVLWCGTCQSVHPAIQAEESCDACHFWDIGRCWHAHAILGASPEPAECQFRRARRAIPPPPMDF